MAVREQHNAWTVANGSRGQLHGRGEVPASSRVDPVHRGKAAGTQQTGAKEAGTALRRTVAVDAAQQHSNVFVGIRVRAAARCDLYSMLHVLCCAKNVIEMVTHTRRVREAV